MAREDKLPDDVLRQVVPELCRMAVEARCRDIVFSRELGRGAVRADVERHWSETGKTRNKVALAVPGDAKASLDGWLAVGRRRAALGICSSAVHGQLHGDPRLAVTDVEQLVNALGSSHVR